jgi:hypothetical protein
MPLPEALFIGILRDTKIDMVNEHGRQRIKGRFENASLSLTIAVIFHILITLRAVNSGW